MRNDIHRPGAIVPADYQFLGLWTVEPLMFAMAINDRENIKAHMGRTGGDWSRHAHGGTCHVCGAWAIYLAAFYHAGTNTYIRTGMDCAAKLDMGDERHFRAFRKACEEARANAKGKAKAQVLLADRDLNGAWNTYLAVEANRDGRAREELTVHDIVSRLVKWGSLSDAQFRFLGLLNERIANAPAVEAQRAAEKAAAADCPEGRVTVEGTVLKTEERDSAFGLVLKLAIKADAGFVLWGNAPAAIRDNVRRGDRVRLTGTVKRSDRDAKFGFFSRPSASIIASAE